jgi:crotonobetainyl-CoA:carnitine CoA-transferase CaiB-like acyl-CoA transferase
MDRDARRVAKARGRTRGRVTLMASGRAPLHGIRVVEVGSFMAGPFCGTQLADLGAEVIKVEPPEGGDQGRRFGPFINGESSHFVRLNRNKRSIALDLKAPVGKEIFKKLVATADIVVENLRPRTMHDLSLDYEGVLRAINPRLIYIAASGWGQDGPLAELAGQDVMAQARSGLMSITGEPDGDPVKVGVPICDLACALYGALAAIAALWARRETGRGQYIDVSLFEAGVSLSIWEAGKYFATGEIPRRLGSAHQNAAPYQAVRTANGHVTIGAVTRPNWIALCRALGLDDLPRDGRFADENGRLVHRDALIEILEAVTMTRTTAAWLTALGEAGVPCAPIQDYGDVYNDPHLHAREFFWDAPHPTLGAVRQLGSPMRFSETKVRRDNAGPILGQDSGAVLTELGYSTREVDDLLLGGAVKGPANEPRAV